MEATPLSSKATTPPEHAPLKMVGGWDGINVEPTTADHVPTSAMVGTTVSRARQSLRRPIVPERAAPAFLNWLRVHGLVDRPWGVDDLWYLASEDFAPAMDIGLPPRNRFLGALQRLDGEVTVQYDKRIWIAGRRVKTTVYTFTPDTSGSTTESVEPVRSQLKRAA